MDRTQAKAILGMTMAYFPTPQLSLATESAWMEALAPLQHECALQAIKALGRAGMPYGRPFHISELVLRTEELQRQTTIVFDADEGRRVLEEVIPAGDEEARSILAAYWERVGYDRRVEAQVRWAERNGNATQRMEVVRQKLHRKLYGEAPADEGQEQPKREPDPDSVLITSCGARAGTAMVQRDDGKWTCPNCGALEGEGCATRKLDAEAAAE